MMLMSAAMVRNTSNEGAWMGLTNLLYQVFVLSWVTTQYIYSDPSVRSDGLDWGRHEAQGSVARRE